MKFTFAHNNFNVTDLDKSLKFYEEASWIKGSKKKRSGGRELYPGLPRRRCDTAPAGAHMAQGLGEGSL